MPLDLMSLLMGGGGAGAGSMDPLEAQGFDPAQIAALRQGALSGPSAAGAPTSATEEAKGGGAGGGLGQNQLLAALMLQGMMQQNQGYQNSPDVGTRAFGMASGSLLPMMNAYAQMPLIKEQQRQAQSKQQMDLLKTLSTISNQQASAGLANAQAEDLPKKRAQEGRKLDMSTKLDEAQLLLDKAGFDKTQTQGLLASLKEHITLADQKFKLQEMKLKIEQESQKDPALAQLLALAKVTKDPALADAITTSLEQKWGVKLHDDRHWYEMLPEILGGKQNPIGQPLKPTKKTATSPVPDETRAAEDEVSDEAKVQKELMGQ